MKEDQLLTGNLLPTNSIGFDSSIQLLIQLIDRAAKAYPNEELCHLFPGKKNKKKKDFLLICEDTYNPFFSTHPTKI